MFSLNSNQQKSQKASPNCLKREKKQLLLYRPIYLRPSSMSFLRINSRMAVKHVETFLHVNAASVGFLSDEVCFSERELDYTFFFLCRPDRPFMIQSIYDVSTILKNTI